MDWKLHAILSLLLYFLIISFLQFPPVYSVQALVILLFASLLPDIDHPKSVVRKISFLMVFYALILFITLGMEIDIGMKAVILAMSLGITYYLFRKLPLKHRGRRSLHLWRYPFVFSGLSLVLFSMANINISLSLFIIIGYSSHLISDRIKKF